MKQLILIAGPCAIESRNLSFEIAEQIKSLCQQYNIRYIFKASYRKANRTRIDSFTGIGDDKALDILTDIKNRLKLEVLTDVHESHEVKQVAPLVDFLQIPAFLCRQTQLLLAAGHSGKGIHIKKGQFLSPEAMRWPIEKIRSTGNNNVMICERGNSFGYNELIVDATSVHRLKKHKTPVIMDCTHALQKPNQRRGITGGNPQLVQTLALSAIATGADGLFIETHPEPAKARSDAHSMLPLNQLENILRKSRAIQDALNHAT